MRTILPSFRLFATILLGAALIVQFSSCKKEQFFSKGNLSFSVDTLVFDTVFTTIGSTTKKFKLYNKENRTIKIEEIALEGGSSSPFRINVDGVSGSFHQNIELEGKDSLFVFVEVTLDPNNGTTPLIIEDRIRFRTNGKDQFVQLAAWGQDAYFHYSYISQDILDTNEGTWPNDKPHVIYGGAFIDSAKTLNILAGTTVYLHKNAMLYNYKGTLNILGSYGNEVIFQGDRLEMDYDDVSGQYYGIYFHEARESIINYAIIKNGTSGIHLYGEDPGNTSYTLNLYNTIISNCARYGVFIYSGAKVKAENCIIAKNGTHSLLVLEGGDFNFNHCHLLGYGSGESVGAAVGISNYFSNSLTQTTTIGSINEGVITNSVIYGNKEYELAIDTLSQGGVTLNFSFVNNLIRSETMFNQSFYQGNSWNTDPLFVSTTNGDFQWYSTSPLNDAASPLYPVSNPFTTNSDIKGTLRSGPDIGAYEKL